VINLGSVAFHEDIDGEGGSLVCASAGALLKAEVQQSSEGWSALDGRASDDITQQQGVCIMAGGARVGDDLAEDDLRAGGGGVADDASPTEPSCHGACILNLHSGDLGCGQQARQGDVVRSVGIRA